MESDRSPSSARRPNGFTLVELLVVIGIIAVLTGILMPVMSKARHQSMSTVCQSNLRQIYTATVMYGNDNRDRWPGPMTTGGSYDASSGKTSPWPFRRAPGMRDPFDPTYGEVFGLPALLHGIDEDSKRTITPLNLPHARYLNGQSRVWICPAANESISQYGNTYMWSTNTLLDRDVTSSTGEITPAWVTGRRRSLQHSQIWVQDNPNIIPGTPGLRAPFQNPAFKKTVSPFPAHIVSSKKRGSWQIFLDGHLDFLEQTGQ